MATRYVTLKDSNGDTLYPQAVATNLAPDSIQQSEIDFSTIDKAQMTYQPRSIAANKDLNTTEFLDLTGYVCDTNAKASTISNSPTSNAFMMEVKSFGNYNKVSTDAWATRIRTITSLYGGDQWVQIVQGGATPGSLTYGPWNVVNRTYKKGQTISYSGENVLLPGRQRSVSGTNYIYTTVPLDGRIASDVTSVTFTPSAYNEAFGDQGTIFSTNNPTTSQLTFSCSLLNAPQRNLIRVTITVVGSYTIQSNHACVVKLSGSFTFS